MPGNYKELHFRCLVCGSTAEDASPVCAGCGNLQTLYSEEEFTETHTASESGLILRKRAVRASLVTPRTIDFLSTGKPAWDEALGGGVVVGSSILVHGPKGTGKTRALCQIAVTVATRLGGSALYASAEMARDLFVRYARQEGLGDAELERLYVSDDRSLESLVSDVAELEPDVIVVDSVQKMRVDDLRGDAALRRVIETGIELSVRRTTRGKKAIVFLVSQVTKENLFAGPSEFGHDVDVLLALRREGDSLIVECEDKNRFATTPRAGRETVKR